MDENPYESPGIGSDESPFVFWPPPWKALCLTCLAVAMGWLSMGILFGDPLASCCLVIPCLVAAGVCAVGWGMERRSQRRREASDPFRRT
jgi:hypothetical protein